MFKWPLVHEAYAQHSRRYCFYLATQFENVCEAFASTHPSWWEGGAEGALWTRIKVSGAFTW